MTWGTIENAVTVWAARSAAPKISIAANPSAHETEETLKTI